MPLDLFGVRDLGRRLDRRLQDVLDEMASLRHDADARAWEMSRAVELGCAWIGGGVGLIGCALVMGQIREFIQGELSIAEAVRFSMLCSDKEMAPDRESPEEEGGVRKDGVDDGGPRAWQRGEGGYQAGAGGDGAPVGITVGRRGGEGCLQGGALPSGGRRGPGTPRLEAFSSPAWCTSRVLSAASISLARLLELLPAYFLSSLCVVFERG